MAQKVFIVLLSLFGSLDAATPAGLCPDNTGAPNVPCVQVPGCNFPENGTLTPQATQCDNEYSDSDCQQLFPCPTTAPTGQATCTSTAGTDAASYPYVRSPACLNTDLQDIALKCES